jgi:hypothetical protein
MDRVDVANVAAAEGLHRAREAVGGTQRHQKMYVVGHQHVAVNGAAVLDRGRRQPIAIAPAIVLAEEDRPSIVAALDHVQRLIGQEIASDPRHRLSPHAIMHHTVLAFAAKIHSDPISLYLRENGHPQRMGVGGGFPRSAASGRHVLFLFLIMIL